MSAKMMLYLSETAGSDRGMRGPRKKYLFCGVAGRRK